MKKHLIYTSLHLPWPRTSLHKPPQTFWLILFGTGRKWEQPVWCPVRAPVGALVPARPVYTRGALSHSIRSTGRSGHTWHWEDAATPAPVRLSVDVLLSTAAKAQSSLQNPPKNQQKWHRKTHIPVLAALHMALHLQAQSRKHQPSVMSYNITVRLHCCWIAVRIHFLKLAPIPFTG